MKNNNDLVSIIMPAFNCELFIKYAIKSVLCQTYSNWELLICDDSSTDRTLEICQKYSKTDSRILLVKNTHSKGAPGARNSCLTASKGRYIAFLDADDIWLEHKLESQISFMQRNDYSFTYTYHKIMQEDGIILRDCLAPSRVDLKMMKISNFIPCLTAIYDTFAIGKIPQPNIPKRNDFALWLKILTREDIKYAYCLTEVTACYRTNSYGLSSNKYQALKYYYLCLIKYSRTSRVHAFILTALYLVVVLVKKFTPNIYNRLVMKISPTEPL